MYLATVQDRDIATMTTSMSANASHTTLAKLIPALTSGELPLEKYIDSLQQRFEEIDRTDCTACQVREGGGDGKARSCFG